MTQVIYKIVNLVNDKFYVGSTTNKKVRFREHRKQLRGNRHHCKHLQAAWNKYGEDKFDFRVVEEVSSEVALHEVEDRWLKEHFGKHYCYNAGAAAVAPWRGVYGAEHFNFGKEMASTQKEQISATLKEFYAQDYFNHPRVGKQHTEETKAQISASKKANPVAYWEGKERSEETKAKISEAQRDKPKAPRTEAHREALRQSALGNQNFLGRTHTEEAKEKMRKPIFALLPDGTRRDFIGVYEAGQELGTPYQMLIRAMKARKPVAKGKFAGWLFCYADAPVEPSAPVEIPEEFKHLPRTRQEAKTQGAKEYFTGMPCTHGHTSTRLTKGTCVACRKAGFA